MEDSGTLGHTSESRGRIVRIWQDPARTGEGDKEEDEVKPKAYIWA